MSETPSCPEASFGVAAGPALADTLDVLTGFPHTWPRSDPLRPGTEGGTGRFHSPQALCRLSGSWSPQRLSPSALRLVPLLRLLLQQLLPSGVWVSLLRLQGCSLVPVLLCVGTGEVPGARSPALASRLATCSWRGRSWGVSSRLGRASCFHGPSRPPRPPPGPPDRVIRGRSSSLLARWLLERPRVPSPGQVTAPPTEDSPAGAEGPAASRRPEDPMPQPVATSQ